MFEPLKVGDKVEFIKKVGRVHKDDEHKDSYNTQILDITDEEIVCAMPFFEGHLMVLEVGTRLDGFFYSSKGIYKADCIVTGRGKEGNIYTVSITPEHDLKKFQRREYFRLDCTIQVAIKVLSDEEKDYFEKNEELPEVVSGQGEFSIIVDISGGGLRVFAKTKYEKNSLVEVTFPINVGGQDKVMRLAGKIVMSLTSPNSKDIFDNRIQFLKVSKEQTEEIVKYIFEQQRLMRKKERG